MANGHWPTGGAHGGMASEFRPEPSAFCVRPSAFSTEGLVAVSADSRWAAHFPGRFYRLVSSPDEARRAGEGGGPLLAAPAVHYAAAAERWRYDIVQSIRTLTLLRQAHPGKDLVTERHFRSSRAMAEEFRETPAAVGRSRELAERCAFELPLGTLQFPAYVPPDGSTPRAFLRRRVMEGLERRYGGRGDKWPLGKCKFQISKLRVQVETELGIIGEVGYEEYFLVVWDLLEACRRRGIEWITRGSAADSLVCYCLGISDVCPIRFGLYFRRFLNKERMAMHKLPDIDVDFPHDRKDDVVNLMFERYGPAHCAVVGGFSTFQARSAFAEVAKVLGVAERDARRFTERFPWRVDVRRAEAKNGDAWRAGSASALADALRARPDCGDLPLDEEPYRSALRMAEFLQGVPRHPKMHPCGVVLSRQPMHELTPTFESSKGYPTTHFDMDAVEAIGLVKMDILAQGGLAVMRDTRALLARRGVQVDLEALCLRAAEASPGQSAASRPAPRSNPVDAVPRSGCRLPQSARRTPRAFGDPAVWGMIAGGQARAVHHIESPAMISLCRMCNVHDLDTLIAIVSVIRPGAANEDRKREFARRYQGLSPVTYPHPSLEPWLRDSCGLLIYEEQVLQICEAFAGLPAGRADVLRRALGKERLDVVAEVAGEFAASARARRRSETDIARVWGMVSGFLGYTFCKAHSTAYGVEAYQSAWLKRYFPAEFMAAVLTNGKGFYRPLVYVLECWRLGLALLPPWVNEPGPGFMVKPQGERPKPEGQGTGPSPAIRVPVSRVKGLSEGVLQRILAERARGEFTSLADFCRRVRPGLEDTDLLIRVGALDGFGRKRTAQFWECRRLQQAWGAATSGKAGGGSASAASGSAFCDLPFALPDAVPDAVPDALAEPARLQRLAWEEELLGFPASGHPLELHAHIAWDTYCPVARLGEFVGQEVVTCGLVIEDRVHHQVTGEPMKFLTLADWTGMIETELFARTYRSYGLATLRYPVLEVAARVEPFENGRGYTLRVLRAGPPRERR
ncbi:MAG: DNA polymerase III subunit alpha [Verrucomicrobia bacterium]|nr:DNA polymerase III subunit alpha [Verrucomicrobiota bacterium]